MLTCVNGTDEFVKLQLITSKFEIESRKSNPEVVPTYNNRVEKKETRTKMIIIKIDKETNGENGKTKGQT